MKTKTKRIGLAVTLVISIVAVAGLLRKNEPPPQIITLPNGDKYQFAGVTYGTRPVPPVLAARLISWLPAPLADRARKRFAASLSQIDHTQSPSPRLFVWFHRLGTNAPSPSRDLRVMLADQAGVVAGREGYPGYPTGFTWLRASFPVVPKRSLLLQCLFYEADRQPLIGKVTFPNPLYDRFPQWQAEPVPAVKKVEGLEVRLDKVKTGYQQSDIIGITGEFRLGPVPRVFLGGAEDSAFNISLRSSEETNTWVLRSAELCDATGNVLRDPVDFFTQPLRTDWGGGYSKLIMGTLWPDEAAWRLKLEFKRTAGIAPGDLVTFRKVPLLKTGSARSIQRTETIGPLRFVLEETMYLDGHGVASPRFHLEIRNAPEDLAANVVRVIADTGAPVSIFQRSEVLPGRGKHSVAWYALLHPAPTNATTVDITWAVQKTRMVEFLVKPPKAE